MEHDYIEEIIELVATKHRDGLRILSGEVSPLSNEELGEIILHHHAQKKKEIDPAIRVPGKNTAPQAAVVESTGPYLQALERVGGWKAIVLGARDAAKDYPLMWKTFCLHVTMVESSGWAPRGESTSTMIRISHKTGGLDAKTIRKYRERMPREISARARMPQLLLFQI